MAGRRLRLTLPIVGLALLLVANTSVAALAPLSAQGVHVEQATQEGAAHLAWIEGLGSVEGVTLSIEAARVTGTEFEQRFIDGPDGPSVAGYPGVKGDVPVPQTGERPIEAEHAVLELTDYDPSFQFGLQPLGGVPVDLSIESRSSSIHAQDGATMDAEGIGEYREVEDGSGSGPTFDVVSVSEPVVVMESGSGAVRVIVEGDFTLELDEMDFQMDADDGSDEVQSTTRHEPVEAFAGLEYEVSGFLRLHLTDARLVFEASTFDGTLTFAASKDTVRPAGGQVTLVQANGTLETPTGRLDLHQESYAPLKVESLDVGSDGSMLQVGVDFHDEKGGLLPMLAKLVPSGGLSGSVVLVLVASMGFLFAVFAASALASPSMVSVEGALERGEYRRAARLAERIEHRRPDETGVQVARAIALTKSGDTKEAIKAAEEAIAKKDPKDGVLHYVLGLAYLNEGRRAEAAARLAEAVRRTPDLRPDVDRMLPGALGATPYGFV